MEKPEIVVEGKVTFAGGKIVKIEDWHVTGMSLNELKSYVERRYVVLDVPLIDSDDETRLALIKSEIRREFQNTD